MLNRARLDARKPITLLTARRVGEVLRHVPADVASAVRYAYYMYLRVGRRASGSVSVCVGSSDAEGSSARPYVTTVALTARSAVEAARRELKSGPGPTSGLANHGR